MAIESVETIPYALSFCEPYVTAKGTLERRAMALLRIRTGEGLEGLGEAVPLSLRGDRPLAEIVQSIDDATTRLVGLDLEHAGEDPLSFAVKTTIELTAPRRLAPAAVAAIEGALFDLAARIAGVPLWELLGAPSGGPVRCNATLSAAEPDAVAAQAVDWAEQGFETFKVKLGAGFDDIATVAAVREAVGVDAALRVDLNESLKPDPAARLLESLEPFRIELAEQPTSGLRGLARVRRQTTVPICADESIASEADAHRAHQRRSCDLATIKLSKVGGIGPARQISAVIPSYLSSALDGPVGIAMGAHAALLLEGRPESPGLAHGLATERLFGETIAASGWRLQDGALHPPEGPGLGVEIDEPALAARRI